MDEVIAQISAILRGMWKFRWAGLAVAWVVGLIGVVVSIRVPDRFDASARIFVDTQSILKPLMAGLAVQPNVDQQVAMLSRTLMSRPNIEKLVRMADLDLKTQSKSQQDALVESLMSAVKISSVGRDNLYLLSYADTDREKAKRVIQSMVSIFVESSLGASRKDTDSAKVFLDEQIKAYEVKLEEAETRLKEFRLRNIEMQLGEGKDSAGRLGDISMALERAKLDLLEAENGRAAAKKQLDAERGQAGGGMGVTQGLLQESGTAVATPEIDARIEAQRRSLDSLMQRYTEQHPDIVNVRRLIKDLEEQKQREVSELRKVAAANQGAGGGVIPAGNAVQQELQRMVATAEVQVASLRARVAEYQARYAQARAATRTSPQIEAEASQLNRDYGIIKKNYEDLVSRRQAAVMSGDLDMASGVADFRLIDPPRVSPKPVSPNRLVLLAVSLAASVVAGLLVPFALSQLRPVFHDAQELRLKSGLPLLGVVSMVLGEADVKRERTDRIRFFAGAGGLVVVFLIVVATVSIVSARQWG